MEFLLRPEARAVDAGAPPGGEPLAFHRTLPGYEPTPLRELPALADRLGLSRLWAKDETSRLGLPAFKILGASWAIERAWRGETALVAATDGNHGRAVAHVARLRGLACRIYVPAGTAPARIDGIASEGASVEVVDGDYDETVARSAADAAETGALVVSDTSWEGYTEIPSAVIEGYSTIFRELDGALAGEVPDLVVIQVGVGALAAAAARHYRPGGPSLVGVEPLDAACVLASARAGRIVSTPGPHRSIMAGLNCGTPSLVAWPALAAFDVLLAVEDERAREAMRLLAAEGIAAGETGASGLAGLLALCDEPELRPARGSSALVLVTEGPTDPAGYAAALA